MQTVPEIKDFNQAAPEIKDWSVLCAYPIERRLRK
jgi:hypothetical protein